MLERSYASLLSGKVFADDEFKKRLREQFVEAVIEGYLGIVANAEFGLSDAELARRIGVNRGQFTRYNKSGGTQRPSLRNFCLRSAAANVSYPAGARVAFGAYCDAFEAVAAQMERPCPPMSPEIACCLYFLFRSLKTELAAGRQGLADSVLRTVIQCVHEYFPAASAEPAENGSHETPRRRGPTVQSPSDVRELLVGRLEIWANLVHVLGAPNDWF